MAANFLEGLDFIIGIFNFLKEKFAALLLFHDTKNSCWRDMENEARMLSIMAKVKQKRMVELGFKPTSLLGVLTADLICHSLSWR